jgi:hypothetical protein
MRLEMRDSLWLIACVLMLCVGCQSTLTSTEVLVSVASDLEVGTELTRVDVEVYAGNGMGLTLQSASFPLVAQGTKGITLPLSFSVVPSSQQDRRTFRVVVTGLGGAPIGPVVEKQVIADFAPNAQTRLEVFLSRQCLGKLCRDTQGRRGDLTCNASGECDTVPVEVSMPSSPSDASSEDPADADAGMTDASPGDDAGSDGDARAPIDASGADAVVASDAGGDASDDAGPVPPGPECDATHACGAGYACVSEKCVSKCTQTQCDPNATCSLMAGAPVCACGGGFIEMKAGDGTVTCLRDVSCEQLACDTNARCELNTDQTRSCVCKPGYSGSGKVCAPVDCGAATLTNGTATAVNGVTTYGGTVNYACSNGYTRSGASSAMCGVDGKWSASASCNPVDCGTPKLTNGTATPTTGETTFGSGVSYACNVGYTRSGAATGTCGSDGKWGGAPTCTIVTCTPTPTNPTGGQVMTSNGNVYNSVASYSCNGGTLQGNATRTCQANGQWSGTQPTCLYCGDGMVTGSEECDPKHPSWNHWNCTTSCVTNSVYTRCFGASDCKKGSFCYTGLNFCTQQCSLHSQCPAITESVTTPFCPIEANSSGSPVCIAAGCRTAADCPPGLNCYVGSDPSTTRYCVDCALSDTCK